MSHWLIENNNAELYVYEHILNAKETSCRAEKKLLTDRNLKHASTNSGCMMNVFLFVFEIRAFKFRCFKRSVQILNFASLYLFILLTIYLFSGAYFECTCFVNYKLSICIIPQNIFLGFFFFLFFKETHFPR